MGKFTVIPKDTFDDLQLDAGVVLTSFDPAKPDVADDAIVCATTGGITVSCVPTFSDLGEDVDNCPVNMRELKHLDSWECKMSFSALGTSPKMIRMALGAADIDGTDTTKVIPRRDLKQSDFTDLWWVGDKADGGLVAGLAPDCLRLLYAQMPCLVHLAGPGGHRRAHLLADLPFHHR